MALSRNWHQYLVKATLKESSERPWPILDPHIVKEHEESIKTGWEAHIFKLPQPILCKSGGINDIVEVRIDKKSIRIYPPFILNENAENAGTFENVGIPEGKTTVEYFRPVSPSASKSMSVQPLLNKPTSFCQGLRLDVENGAPTQLVITVLLEQICQHCHQWWLRSGTALFNGMKKFGIQLTKDYKLAEELKYHGAEPIYSTWYTTRQPRSLLGIEVPLDNSRWLLVCHNVSIRQRADQGLIAFHNAIASYMAFEDEQCVLNLALCVEILGNKRRLLMGQSDVDANKLLTSSDLVDESNRKILKMLFIDRGHVAHGREFHFLNSDKGCMIEHYIEATRKLLKAYLDMLKPGEWPKASQLSIKRTKRKKN